MGDGMRTVRRRELRGLATVLRNVSHLFGYAWRLRALLRRHRVDLVHVYTMKSVVYGGFAGRLAGLPVVWHLHNRIASDWLPAPAVWAMRGLSYALPQAIICVSQSTADSVPRRSTVIVNCLDEPPGGVPIPDGAAAAGIGTGRRPVPLRGAGPADSLEGAGRFRRAFAASFPDGEERARLIGAPLFEEHDYEAELVALRTDLGLEERVEFRGFRSDVWGELSQLDALVHCSVIPEPFGQVVVEGLVAGLPVIATRDGGPGEIITDGVDGLLVRNRDVDHLAAALRRVRDDPDLRDHLVAGARGSAARFGPGAFRDGVLAIYAPLVEKKAGRSRWGRADRSAP